MQNAAKYLFIEVERGCNLACKSCTYWQRPRGADPLNRAAIVRDFANAGGQNVVTCGGEPMLDKAAYYDAIGTARRAGLRAFTVTNGTMLQSEDAAYYALRNGAHEWTVSVDHWKQDENDALRGRGAWLAAKRAITSLLSVRKREGFDNKVNAMAVLQRSNAADLFGFYVWALDMLGVDKLKLNPIQPVFGGLGYPDDCIIEDTGKLRRDLITISNTWRLDWSHTWIAQVVMHFEALKARAGASWRDAAGHPEVICNSGERNIMVDGSGVMRLCFAPVFPGRKWQKPGDIAAFWQEGDAWRQQMATCRRWCGISHSVRREPATRRLPVVPA